MFEVCANGLQRNGGEVGSSDFFGSQADAMRFAGEKLEDMEGGDWVYGCVTVYGPDGSIVDTFTADRTP